MRLAKSIWIRLTVVLPLVLAVGCNVEVEVDIPRSLVDSAKKARSSKKQAAKKSSAKSTVPIGRPAALPVAANDRVRIASFNIQVLGKSKIGKPDVVATLVETIRQFDVVAIQELRSKDQTVVGKLVDQVNADGHSYEYAVGPRLGRTTSKEQYVFVFDSRRIELIRGSLFTVDDPKDHMHREPFVGRFRVRTEPPSAGFTFALANIHTDPDETDIELDALDDAFRQIQARVAPEDDVIMLGDLNVSSRKLGELGRIPNITWTVDGEATNTLGTKSYDNILFVQTATTEYTRTSGVFHFGTQFGLSKEAAMRVSDHLPVWAEFSAFESGRPVVAGASVPLRR